MEELIEKDLKSCKSTKEKMEYMEIIKIIYDKIYKSVKLEYDMDKDSKRIISQLHVCYDNNYFSSELALKSLLTFMKLYNLHSRVNDNDRYNKDVVFDNDDCEIIFAITKTYYDEKVVNVECYIKDSDETIEKYYIIDDNEVSDDIENALRNIKSLNNITKYDFIVFIDLVSNEAIHSKSSSESKTISN